MKTGFLNDRKMPFVVEPEGEGESSLAALVSICEREREFLRENLLACGALLLRGFSIESPADFEQVVRAFSGKELLNYAGGVSPRIELGGGVYTSTEYPSALTLSLHNELSYSHRFPENVYFCCLVAPEQGGETPIGDSRRILQNIDADLVEEFKAKQIRYDRNLAGEAGTGYSWREAFETQEKAAVEDYCREAGIDFRWRGDGGLRLSQTRPATMIHPLTGEEVWFNQADGFHPSNLDEETYKYWISVMPEEDFRLNARFGDGSPLDVSQLERVREVLRSEMVIFPWQQGDVLILDNVLAAHGRMPFSGARRVVLAMT